MKKILIASYDMEVGGVERSLAGMLEHFDYHNHEVDLMLYRHSGDFMALLSDKVNLLDEQAEYSSFRKSIPQLLTDRQFFIFFSRIIAKIHTDLIEKIKGITEPGYYQMQLMWKYALPFLPKKKEQYDTAISYLWPHYFVADKVDAKIKIAWIHTDYSTVEVNQALDLEMWNKFDHIIAVSEACKQSFLSKYGVLNDKVSVIENITSPEFINLMADESLDNPMQHDTRFKLITVARLSHAKGIDNAVKALKILKDKGYVDIVWYIVGYGGDETLIRELIAQNCLEDQFILLGKKTNPYPYIRSSDMYVQPSRYEGKAVTVTEAKILGKPVLITNYSTAHSQVIDGVDGCITELSVEGIAAGIEELYHNQEKRRNLSQYCSQTDYGNRYELEQLYGFISEREEGLLRAL